MDKVFEYLRLENNRPIGAGRLAPLIIMVNNDKKIVKELLDPNYQHYQNLWVFLDYALRYTLTDDMDTLDHITYILTRFNSLDNKDTITGDEFVKLLKEV